MFKLKETPCGCKVCDHHREFVDRLQAISREPHEFFEDLYDRWAHADMDSDYWESKFKGDWPDEAQERADYEEDRKGVRAFEYLMWELQK
jgi:hypothetical protein